MRREAEGHGRCLRDVCLHCSPRGKPQTLAGAGPTHTVYTAKPHITVLGAPFYQLVQVLMGGNAHKLRLLGSSLVTGESRRGTVSRRERGCCAGATAVEGNLLDPCVFHRGGLSHARHALRAPGRDEAAGPFFKPLQAALSYWKNEGKNGFRGSAGGGENRPHALYECKRKLTGFPLV